MATSIRPTAPLAEALQFRPRWWWDPVPDWVLDHLSAAVIKEIGAIQVRAQLEVLQIQQKALEETLAVMRKAK